MDAHNLAYTVPYSPVYSNTQNHKYLLINQTVDVIFSPFYE